MKTFANLRNNPMTSLRDITVENLARLGGHSYIMIMDLGPPPLQLPACIVAAVMYLHRYGRNYPRLFIECKDLKAAIDMYDGWAEHVHEARKLQDQIDLTMRVISMPRLSEGTAPVLSVAWALKAVLAGLPNGILGSVRLYQILRDLFYASIPETTALEIPKCLRGVNIVIAIRTQLIALAVIALTTEMQRDLICTVFGLIDYLVNPDVSDSAGSTQSGLERQRSTETKSRPRSHHTGTKPRRSVAPLNYQELVPVFAPLLLGQQSRRKLGMEQCLEETRVATLLIEHWHNVNRQLRSWSRDTYVPGRE